MTGREGEGEETAGPACRHTLFFFPQEHGTLTNVRAFHVQVDGSCQGRAGPNTFDSLVPTSTSTPYIQLLWHSSQLALNFIHVVCAVLDKAQTTFSESYNQGKLTWFIIYYSWW